MVRNTFGLKNASVEDRRRNLGINSVLIAKKYLSIRIKGIRLGKRLGCASTVKLSQWKDKGLCLDRTQAWSRSPSRIDSADSNVQNMQNQLKTNAEDINPEPSWAWVKKTFPKPFGAWVLKMKTGNQKESIVASRTPRGLGLEEGVLGPEDEDRKSKRKHCTA